MRLDVPVAHGLSNFPRLRSQVLDGALRLIGDQAPSVIAEPDPGDAIESLDAGLDGVPAALEPAEEDVEINALTGRRRRSFYV